MAFLAQDDKQDQNQNGQQQGQAQNLGSAGSAGSPVVGNSASGGSTVSTAGVGAGGGGAWTNIQSYLNANQGNQGSSNLLNSKVGSAFDQESQNEKNQATQTKQQSDQAVAQNKIGQDQASKLVEQLGGQYNAQNQKQSDDYTNQVNQYHNQLYGSYSGPSQFNYAVGGQAQQWGSGLGNDQGFQGVMNDLYQQQAPGMGSGQKALQSQLDTNDQNLQSARQNLLNRYSGLQSDIKNDINSTNQSLQANANQWSQDQQAARDYLQNTLGNQYKSAIDKKVSDANAEEARIASGAEKPLLNSADTYHHKVNLSKWLGDHSDYSQADIDPMQYLSYRGSKATENNLASADPERNRFDAIQDLLGNSGSKISRDAQDYKHGGYVFDEDKARKYFNQNMSDWDFDGAVD